MSSAAAASVGLPQPGTLPGDPVAVLVEAARVWLIGKKRTFPFSGHDMTLTLSDISVGGGTSPGSWASTATWASRRGTSSGTPTSSSEWRSGPGTCTCGRVCGRHWWPRPCTARPSSPPRSRRAGWPPCHPSWRWSCRRASRSSASRECRGCGWNCRPVLRGRSISVRPRAVYLLDRRVSLRSPAFFLPIPDLPDGFMLTSVDPAPGGFLVRGLFSEWQRSLSRETSSGCWPRCAPDRTASTSDLRKLYRRDNRSES